MAGHLTIATIIFAVGLLAGACSGGGGSEPTATSTSPVPTATQVSPTQTAIPDGVVSPASTAGWLTYTSPLGFSFDFPEDWTLNEHGVACCLPQDRQGISIDLINPTFELARQAALEAHGGPSEFLPPPGAVKMDIILLAAEGAAASHFDAPVLIQRCEDGGIFAPEAPKGTPGTPQETTLDGQPAVICERVDRTQPESVPYSFRWIELPSGRTLFISPVMIQPSEVEIRLVEEILNSLTFADEPPIDTAAWPTFSSPLGFSIKYPPGWTVQESGADHVYIRNERAVAERERRIAEGIHEFSEFESGEAWLYLGPGPPGDYDLEGLLQICGSPSPEEMYFAGQLSLRCGRIIYASMPGGGIFQVLTAVMGEDTIALQLIDAALRTASFGAAQ